MVIDAPAALSAALAYAARGWPVLPIWWPDDGFCACPNPQCTSAGKHPLAHLVPHGLTDATTDADTIRAWWRRFPEANVGIATGARSFIALDVDTRHGGDESLRVLEDSIGSFPAAPVALTGGGGQHILFAHPGEGEQIRNKIGTDWGLPGLDVRGDGGYIVAPPSLHANGTRYTWELTADPDDLPLPALPEKLRLRLAYGGGEARNGHSSNVGHTVIARSTDIGEILEGVSEGQRGVKLFREASKLRGAGVPYAYARDLVLRSAAAARPPLPEREAVKHLDSAYERYTPNSVEDDDATTAPGEEPPQRFRWWTLAELERQPPPVWLVRDVFVERTFAMTVGRERSLKSFLMLDMGLAIASGTAWQGHPVKQGPVAYVVAEGQSGVLKRAEAWCIARNQRRPEGFKVLPQSVQLLEASDVEALLASILAWPAMPVVIFIDTLARCFVGGDENAAKDMGVFIAACERLRLATGATVVVVHHGTKASGEARGSSVLLAAVDTHLHVTRDGDVLTLKCEKQKDFDEFEPLYLTTRIVPLEQGETSLVLERTGVTAKGLSASQQAVLDVLTNVLGGYASRDSDWLDAARNAGVSRRTYYRAKRDLIDAGRVTAEGGKGQERFLIKENKRSVPSANQVPTSAMTPEEVSATSAISLRDGTWHQPGTESVGLPVCIECGLPTNQDRQCWDCHTRPCLDCGRRTLSPMSSRCQSCGLKAADEERR